MSNPFIVVNFEDKETLTSCLKCNLTIDEAAVYFNIGEKNSGIFVQNTGMKIS